MGMSIFEKLHRTRTASTRHGTSVDELPPSTLRGPLLSPDTDRGLATARVLPFMPRHAPISPTPSPRPRTSFSASCCSFSSSSGIILPLKRTDLRTVTSAVNRRGTVCKWHQSPPTPPRLGFWILSPLPSICLHKAHILSTNPKKGSRLLHGVMTLHSERPRGERETDTRHEKGTAH